MIMYADSHKNMTTAYLKVFLKEWTMPDFKENYDGLKLTLTMTLKASSIILVGNTLCN